MAASPNTVHPRGPTAQPQPTMRPWPFSSQRLVEQLVAGAYLPPATVSAAVADATASGRPVVNVLLERGVISDVAMRDAMSSIYNLPAVELDGLEADDDVADFPSELARKHLLLPLGYEDDRLVLAIADPTRAGVLREVHRAVGHTLDLRLAAYGELARAVQDVFAPRVVVKAPDGRKTTFLLPPGDLKIGRAAHNEIVIPDAGVSATHAVLRGRGDGYEVVDLGSRNGVFVEGERVHGPRTLQHKDEIVIGATSIKFKWPYRREQERLHASESDGSKTKNRMRAAWITFAGRIIAQMLGAAAIIFLGLAIGGGLPASCSMPSASSDGASVSATGAVVD